MGSVLGGALLCCLAMVGLVLVDVGEERAAGWVVGGGCFVAV